MVEEPCRHLEASEFPRVQLCSADKRSRANLSPGGKVGWKKTSRPPTSSEVSEKKRLMQDRAAELSSCYILAVSG